MTVTTHWFLPTHGDGRSIVDRPHATPEGAGTPRRPDIDYLAQVAQAAEHLGFTGMLTPTGSWCQDAWITTAALLARTQRIKFLVAFRPGSLTPTLAAQLATTYQRVSGGRLLLNIVTGGESTEQQRYGDWLDHDQRYERTDEFLAVLRGIFSGEPFDFDGRHYQVRGATAFEAPDPRPQLYFGGSSEAALPVAARRADVHLTWGEPPDAVARKVKLLRELATEEGRALRFGLRAHVITRDTSEDAWATAQRFLDQMDPADVAASQAKLNASESTGQRNMVALHGGALRGGARELEVHPGLWAGVGLLRGGAGTAFVGSHREVADLIEEYHSVGIEEFVLSGYPHLEEAYWFGEGVHPELARRGLC
ncbi:alkanesulfonate monooxygenase [Saccharopolyspora antimicrobica]|uniref:Alkanesulfonate monooxygenase n=1 Tax=Saccharopolyspora antimicrobica TaxID=455193 RepID=A0A1I4S1M3_9PSEU|nr:LLM class flavin-dependent oxidoreductase [Saccharopolyspora antimicrobica]RKT87544.1 alkanesulfonate monooxygenase [Saccharopolyspora antimicrobica]SFM58311.1 alkanesulfonate monooxygenase [Saccharopolyspora antimicrobica]